MQVTRTIHEPPTDVARVVEEEIRYAPSLSIQSFQLTAPCQVNGTFVRPNPVPSFSHFI